MQVQTQARKPSTLLASLFARAALQPRAVRVAPAPTIAEMQAAALAHPNLQAHHGAVSVMANPGYKGSRNVYAYYVHGTGKVTKAVAAAALAG
jgi:hypothetical protein